MKKAQIPHHTLRTITSEKAPFSQGTALWDLDIGELDGHNLEVKGREEVNEMLKAGWILLHLYTLTYKEDGVWRERPMAILGLPRQAAKVAQSKARVLRAHGIPLQE